MVRKTLMSSAIVLLGVGIVIVGIKLKTQGTGVKDEVNITVDWDAERKECIKGITSALYTIIAGDTTSYTAIRNAWLSRVQSDVQGEMFPLSYPPQGCSAAISYLGYSGENYNSDGAEYIYYKARCMNNQSLESVDYKIRVKLSQGKTDYIITGFNKEIYHEN